MPTAINLHSRSRMLEIAFADGARFELPCEYLRVFSPAAEVRAAQARGEVISGKEQVNITGIIPVGSYAIQLQFDDGHDTGIYSWKTLHDLGLHRSRYWAEYLQGLERAGHRRETPRRDPGTPLRLQVLYFATLAEKLGLTVEEVAVPGSVQDVASLLECLRARGADWAQALRDDAVTVTLNKQFAPLSAVLYENDELAIVPVPGSPPTVWYPIR